MAQARKKSESSVSVQLFRHLRQLLRESGFLLLLGIAIFLLLALLSYHPQDPAWTHTASDGAVRNLGGTVGALFADVVHYLVPELQRRGVYPTAYREGTLREKLFGDGPLLPDTHPAARYRDLASLQPSSAAVNVA